MYLKPRKQIHAKFNISNDCDFKSTRNLIQLKYHKNDWDKRMNTNEYGNNSNFIAVKSNFNSPYYKTQAEKCLVNSCFSSKGRFLGLFAKWKNKWKFKSYSQQCIPYPLTHFRPKFHLCRNQVVGFY